MVYFSWHAPFNFYQSNFIERYLYCNLNITLRFFIQDGIKKLCSIFNYHVIMTVYQIFNLHTLKKVAGNVKQQSTWLIYLAKQQVKSYISYPTATTDNMTNEQNKVLMWSNTVDSQLLTRQGKRRSQTLQTFLTASCLCDTPWNALSP